MQNEGSPEHSFRFSKKQLIALIIPLIIEQTLNMTVGMFDTIMVSSAGEAAMSGVSLVESFNYLLISLFAAFATGGAIVAGQYLGRKDYENSNRAAKQLVVAIFAFAVCVMGVCLLLNRQLLSLIFGQIEADVMQNARAYFYVTAISYPFIALFNSSAALFRGMGNSKISMVNALIMNVANLVGNAIFIYGFGWGAFGAGFSTLLSRMLAALTMTAMLRNPALVIHVRSYSLRDLDWSMIKRILRIGIPNGFENSIFQIGKIIMAGLVATFGTAAIAANAVGNSLTVVGVIPGQAMGLAMTTVVAQCVGAGEYDQANFYIKKLIQTGYLLTILLNVGILLLLDPILGFYNLAPSTAALARQILLVHNIGAMFIWPTAFSLPNAFRAAGDVRYTMLVSIFSMWAFRIGCSYALAYVFDMGVLSIWFAMLIDWVVRSALFLWRWKSGKWRQFSAIRE